MPATYPTPEYPRYPTCTTLTVGELIQILAKQPLSAPVVLTYEGVETGVSLAQIAVEHGCVVIDAEMGSCFSAKEWAERGDPQRL